MVCVIECQNVKNLCGTHFFFNTSPLAVLYYTFTNLSAVGPTVPKYSVYNVMYMYVKNRVNKTVQR